MIGVPLALALREHNRQVPKPTKNHIRATDYMAHSNAICNGPLVELGMNVGDKPVA